MLVLEMMKYFNTLTQILLPTYTSVPQMAQLLKANWTKFCDSTVDNVYSDFLSLQDKVIMLCRLCSYIREFWQLFGKTAIPEIWQQTPYSSLLFRF